MSTIREYAAGNSLYDSYNDIGNFSGINKNASAFLAGLNMSTDSGGGTSLNLSDYAMIKRGTYGKLMKAYYAQEKSVAKAGGDSSQKLTLMGSSAGSMAKSAQALMRDSLWEKKTIEEKDEKTGEVTSKEDYDWTAITKAVKSFVDDYNSVVDKAWDSNTKEVLRNASWMTKTTKMNERLLSKAGITVGSGDKLELDESELKKADISTLKSLFTGTNSYADKIYDKAVSISNAAARAGGTYTSTGTYSKALSQIVSSRIDTKE